MHASPGCVGVVSASVGVVSVGVVSVGVESVESVRRVSRVRRVLELIFQEIQHFQEEYHPWLELFTDVQPHHAPTKSTQIHHTVQTPVDQLSPHLPA